MIATRFLLLLLVAALLPLALTGCDASDDDARTLFGTAVDVGDGTARSYVEMDASGMPAAVGVVLTAAALDGLPDGSGGHAPHEMMHTLPIAAEARAAGLPFDHLSLDWNPHGHEPEGLFTVPHFDVHFYMVPEATRSTWTPADPLFRQKGLTMPAAKYVPQGFFTPPGTEPVPMMGAHWVDSTDPTYAPGGPGFGEVFIWGSYDGQVVFAEPMITRALLKNLPASGGAHQESLAQPQAFAKAGRYPTRYSIRYDGGRKEYRIELGGLTQRSAS